MDSYMYDNTDGMFTDKMLQWARKGKTTKTFFLYGELLLDAKNSEKTHGITLIFIVKRMSETLFYKWLFS